MAAPSNARRFVRFGIVGGTGVLVNLALLTLLVEATGWHYLVAALVSIEASTLTNYVLNRAWTWRDRDRSWWSLLSYHGVTFVGLVLQWTVLLLGVSLGGLHYAAAALLGIGAGTAWNFAANHRVTFTQYTPERRRRHVRIACYAAAVVLHLGIAAVLTHDWDTFVFERSVEEFLNDGTTPYETGAEKPDYVYVGVGMPSQALWYAYPPLPLLFMSLTYAPAAYGAVSAPWLGRILVKLPVILANLGVAFLAYRLTSSAAGAGPERVESALRLERFLLFNPLVVLVATVWGQFESLVLLFLLLSFFALRHERWGLAGAAWGAAALVKIFPIYLAPVLAVHLLRRAGLRAAARFFVLGGLIFAVVSLPFFLIEPRGYLDQVFMMHAERRPGRFAPVAYIFEVLKFTSHEWPGVLPTDAGLIHATSVLSFTATVAGLGLLAVASARQAPTERSLLLWCALSILGGLLATKVVSEQYIILPLVLVALWYYHPGRPEPGSPRAELGRSFLIGATAVFCVAAALDNFHFLLFVPEDVATYLLDGTIPQTIYGLAAAFGLTVSQFRIVLGTIITLLLVVAYVAAFRLLVPGLRDGFREAQAAVHRLFHRVHLGVPHAGRIALVAATGLLLVPALTVGVLSDKREVPPLEGGLREGPLVLAHYRSDWYNPSKRPDVAGGSWATIPWTPANGYYESISHKFIQDTALMRAAGADGFVIHFDPVFEFQAFAAYLVAEEYEFPHALEIDLRYLADGSGRVGFTQESADEARELVDGPGEHYWRGGYHLRLEPGGGAAVFLTGAWRVRPTFTDDEVAFVADYLPGAAVEGTPRFSASWGASLLGHAPTNAEALAADNPSAARWRDAYALAELAWWDHVFGFADDGTRISLVADGSLPPAVDAGPWVEWAAVYEPVGVRARVSAPGADRAVPASIPTVAADLSRPESYDDAWSSALARGPRGVLVPWNDFDHDLAIEPTLEHADRFLWATRAWSDAFHGAPHDGERRAAGDAASP